VAALRRLSKNVNGPGAARAPKAFAGGAIGRAQEHLLATLSAKGIVLIELRPATQAADVAIVPGPKGTSVTLDLGTGATPQTAPLTSSLGQPVTYAATGTKDVSVTVPTNYAGQAQVTV
jgi:hypothetical protein